MKFSKYCIITLFTIIFYQANSQYQFDNVLYGAAYYHEYMPSPRLDQDIRMMKEANLNIVRVGESTWSLFEPQEGVFEFAWMDTILNKTFFMHLFRSLKAQVTNSISTKKID